MTGYNKSKCVTLGKEAAKAKVNARRRNDIAQLKDWYVCSLITKGSCLKSQDLPRDFIELKKATLMFKRLIREKMRKI